MTNLQRELHVKAIRPVEPSYNIGMLKKERSASWRPSTVENGITSVYSLHSQMYDAPELHTFINGGSVLKIKRNQRDIVGGGWTCSDVFGHWVQNADAEVTRATGGGPLSAVNNWCAPQFRLSAQRRSTKCDARGPPRLSTSCACVSRDARV